MMLETAVMYAIALGLPVWLFVEELGRHFRTRRTEPKETTAAARGRASSTVSRRQTAPAA